MVGLDTNVIVRYIVQDDEKQSKRATDFITNHCTTENPGYLNLIVMVEIFWVFESCYQYSSEQIYHAIQSLLDCPQIEIEANDAVWNALQNYKNLRVDFSDALIGEINKLKECRKTATFDKVAGKLPYFVVL